MSNLVDFAENELELAKVEPEVRPALIAAVAAFGSYGHSGTSAEACADILYDLIRFRPLSPLTGEDNEWIDVTEIAGETVYQNRRDSEVFKDDNGAYWSCGRVFYDKKTDTYSTKQPESRVFITFPWIRPVNPFVVEE